MHHRSERRFSTGVPVRATAKAALFATAFAALMIFRIVRHELDLRAQLKRARTKVLPPKSVTPAKKKFWSGELVVARIFAETHDTKTFRFVLPVDPARRDQTCRLPVLFSHRSPQALGVRDLQTGSGPIRP